MLTLSTHEQPIVDVAMDSTGAASAFPSLSLSHIDDVLFRILYLYGRRFPDHRHARQRYAIEPLIIFPERAHASTHHHSNEAYRASLIVSTIRILHLDPTTTTPGTVGGSMFLFPASHFDISTTGNNEIILTDLCVSELQGDDLVNHASPMIDLFPQTLTRPQADSSEKRRRLSSSTVLQNYRVCLYVVSSSRRIV